MSEFLELMENWDGYFPVSASPINLAAVPRTVELLVNLQNLPRHRHEYILREAITTSDFPALFGFVLERDILARYQAVTAEWRTYCPVGALPNFNEGELHKVSGQDNRLPRVQQKQEYPISPTSDAHYHRRVYKYGRLFDISWEGLVNDALGAMRDTPQRFADAVLRTQAYDVTSIYASATGPNTLLFGAPITDVDDKAVTNVGALPLNIANLETTLGLMAGQVDVNGEAIAVRGVHLVVPPLLEFTARQIVTSGLKMYVDVQGGAGAVVVPYPTTNVMSQIGLQAHVDPMLPVVDVSAKRHATWYVFAEAGQGKSMQMDFLAGYELPEICMKASDKMSVGGALLNPFSGDFETDNVLYRVRCVHGGIQLDPRFAYAQTGS